MDVYKLMQNGKTSSSCSHLERRGSLRLKRKGGVYISLDAPFASFLGGELFTLKHYHLFKKNGEFPFG